MGAEAKEQTIATYADRYLLTDRRLIIHYRNAQESFPLSKITAVRVHFVHEIGALIGAVSLITFGLVFLLLAAFSAIPTSSEIRPPGFITAFVFVFLALLFIGPGIIAYKQWRAGKTNLIISQMGGSKIFSANGNDSN